MSSTPRTDEQYNREKQYRSITNVKMSPRGFDAMTILCAELERELAEAKAQLPAEMQECNIVFKQCKLGHGWLTATNWVQHECQICELAETVAKERERCALVCERKIDAPAGTYQILMAAAKEIRKGE